MGQTVANYRWSAENFLRAWEAGAFDGRVELIEGEVWPVVTGRWHGKAWMRVARRLPELGTLRERPAVPGCMKVRAPEPAPPALLERGDLEPVRVQPSCGRAS